MGEVRWAEEVRARPRIVLADDHRDVLEEMSTLLTSDFEIVRLVREGLSLIRGCARARAGYLASSEFSLLWIWRSQGVAASWATGTAWDRKNEIQYKRSRV
jgi:hypothetical protein